MSSKYHIFYLHGRIIELQGINAISEDYGPYLYTDIIDSLSIENAIVYAQVRTEQTDFYDFCQQISHQVDSLINIGVNSQNISVIGASKGGVMAMYISHLNMHPINYILLGANNDAIENYEWNLHGNILGIYEKTDTIAGKNYHEWIIRSNNVNQFVEIELNLELGHAFLYSPLLDWLKPTLNWIRFQKP